MVGLKHTLLLWVTKQVKIAAKILNLVVKKIILVHRHSRLFKNVASQKNYVMWMRAGEYLADI